MIKIERGIPMPDSVRQRKRREKYPFADMLVDDTVAIAYGVKNPKIIAARACKIHAPKIFVAGTDDKGVWRIWRRE